jgi:hypothetical protein
LTAGLAPASPEAATFFSFVISSRKKAICGKVGTETKLRPENLKSTPIIYVAAHLWQDAAEN